MEIRPLRASDLDRAFALDADAFHVDEERRETWQRSIDPARGLGVFEGERLLAMTYVHGFGQFFGGRAVPMGGVASVAVVPDARRRGLARQLLRRCLEEMDGRGEVVSTLFPATTGLYRSLGWELAGGQAVRKVLPSLLRDLPRPSQGGLRPARDDDAPAIRACYAALARQVDGCLDRSERWWVRREEERRERDAYLFEGEGGALEGYLVYRQLDGEYSAVGGDFALAVDELVASTRDAALGLWGLLATWASQVDQILFRAPPDDPVLLMLPEPVFETLAEVRWMTRVLDATGAVAARGFPPGLDLEVPLRVRDPERPANDGAFVLTVQKGRGALARGRGEAGPLLDAGAFASLFTGFFDTGALARAGRLQAGSADERAALDAAFAGPRPWMLDEF